MRRFLVSTPSSYAVDVEASSSAVERLLRNTIFLQEHLEFLQKARDEQLEIMKNLPPSQTGLTIKDFWKMEYLSKVIDETLRIVNISFVGFRDATSDIKVNGYIIPSQRSSIQLGGMD